MNTGRTHFKKGMTPWNKEKRFIGNCFLCGKEFNVILAKKNQKYCSIKCSVKMLQRPGIIKKRVQSVIGKKRKKYVKGEKHGCWRGGKPNCSDCGTGLSSIYASRCRKCYGISISSENSHKWKGGRPSCSSCGKEKITYGKTLCHKCSILRGENSPRWIKDRSNLIKRQERNDSAYCGWRMSVWIRDAFKCKIANDDCGGRIEAHHILRWSEYVELRYELNNGITLCQAHHPAKRAEEKRLVPVFRELVSVSK